MSGDIQFYKVEYDFSLGLENWLKSFGKTLQDPRAAQRIAGRHFCPPVPDAQGRRAAEVGLLPLEGDRSDWTALEISRQVVAASCWFARPEDVLALGMHYTHLLRGGDILCLGAFWVHVPDMTTRCLYLYSTGRGRARKYGAQLLANTQDADRGTRIAVVRD